MDVNLIIVKQASIIDVITAKKSPEILQSQGLELIENLLMNFQRFN